MSEFADGLPGEPLALSVAEELAARDGRFVPVSVVESAGSQRVCAMLIEGTEQFRGVGYDETANHWEVVAEAPETGTLDGFGPEERQPLRGEVRDALEQWADLHYENPKTVVDDQ